MTGIPKREYPSYSQRIAAVASAVLASLVVPSHPVHLNL